MEHSNMGKWSLSLDARQKMVNKITITLQKHMPQIAPEGMNDFEKIASRFEEKIYNAAADQQDYLRKISLKMLSLETRSQVSGGKPLDIESSDEPNVVKEKKPRSRKGSKPPPSHPTYFQMITEAITSLKKRRGSSYYAITQYIDAKYRTQLPPNYKKILTGQLRKLAKSGKLTKIKGSFKVPAQLNKALKPKPVKAAPAKKTTSAKPKLSTKKLASKPNAAAAKPSAEGVKAPKIKVLVVSVKKADKPPAKRTKLAGPKKPSKPVEKKAAAPKAAKKALKKGAEKTRKKAKKWDGYGL